jgi:hypothetical protein
MTTSSEIRAYAKQHRMSRQKAKSILNGKPLGVTLYHYTKGFHLNSILSGGFIAREGEGADYIPEAQLLFDQSAVDNMVWLTQEQCFVLAALPICWGDSSAFPWHQDIDYNTWHSSPDKNDNLNFLSKLYAGLFRFVFNSANPTIQKYKFHDVRRQMRVTDELVDFENICHRNNPNYKNEWWVSSERLPIAGVQIEKWVDGEWISYTYDSQELSDDLEIHQLMMYDEQQEAA